ncbi:MAG: hypothetical protein IJO08_00310 [Clostridia bacterium]|nr:hypothetical protein [Clostridia bacterium]
MKRIDKIISEHTHYTRSEIKKLIFRSAVLANDERVKNSEDKCDENKEYEVTLDIPMTEEIMNIKF